MSRLLTKRHRQQNGLCIWCGEPMWLSGELPAKTFAQRHGKYLKVVQRELRATKEHVIPRSHGGGSDSNIVAAHSKCNNERGSSIFSKKPLPHVAIHLPMEVQYFIAEALKPKN